MIVFFSWGVETKKAYGSVKQRCLVCNNQSHDFVRVRTWFALFFIPTIPYSTRYFKVCPQCGNGVQLTKEQFAEELEARNCPPSAPTPSLPDVIPSAPVELRMREITVVRGKTFIASLAKINICVDGEAVAFVKNGKTVSFDIDNRQHILYATMKGLGEIRSNVHTIEPSNDRMRFRASINSGDGVQVGITLNREE